MVAVRKEPLSLKYFKDINSGKIVACRKMQLLAKKMIPKYKAKGGKYHFDQEIADKAVNFIERFCCQPAGRIGQPLKLELYEIAWTEVLFGFVDDNGLRQFRDVLIMVGRKNGKTSWAAAVSLYMLIADGEGAPQVVNAANTLDQAELLFKAVMSMRRQSPHLNKHTRKREGDLFCEHNLGTLKPLASNSSRLDGLDIHLAILDEIHEMNDGALYDVLKQGMSARVQPLLLQITTNGFVRGGILDSQYEYATKWLNDQIEDDHFLAFIYELDSRDEWLKGERYWIKANPGLGTVKNIDALKENVQKAKNSPRFKSTLMTKDFNMPENQAVAWLTFQEAVNEEVVDFSQMGFRYGICGFDASDTIDLTCAQFLMMRPGDDKIYERSMYWIPEDAISGVSDKGRKERDGVPYQQWIARGLLRTVPGNKIPKSVLIEWLLELQREGLYTYAVGFDPWHMDDTTRQNLELLVGKDNSVPIIQGPRTLSNPMKQIQADYAANRIVDNNHPINNWCRMNVAIRSDINDNIQPDKKGRNPKNRIDGFAAEIDAYIMLMNKMDDYKALIGR